MRQVFSQIPRTLGIPKVRRTPEQALSAVTSKSGLGVYASADRLFKGAVFGRDSLEVAEDMMYIKPKLVRQILLTIASLQGEVNNPVNEEEPGKIIHEYRTPVVDGKPLDQTSKEIYQRLSEIWGGSENSLAYYGSIDATPHFIKVLSIYCQEYGMEILLEQVRTRSGRQRSVLDVFEGAIDWLLKHLDKSQSGFVEYLRRNPRGIENQVWKDSREFYVHKDGELANHGRPISSIEVQSLAYDAFIYASEILPSRKNHLVRDANKIRQLVFDVLWQDESDYFALGTDFGPDGQLRVIETMTANPAALLDSRIFDDLKDTDKQRYIYGIISEIYGTSFITDAGFRSRALSEAELIENWDYHGSFVTWPKESFDIIKGFRRQGMFGLAKEGENRLINVTKASKSYPEFFYVDGRGRVLGVPTKTRYHGDIVEVLSSNLPERIQAWTVSAVVAINKGRRAWAPVTPEGAWRSEIEKEVLGVIPHVPRLRSQRELSARYPFYPYELNNL
jgi:glycogen debranching enzyme